MRNHFVSGSSVGCQCMEQNLFRIANKINHLNATTKFQQCSTRILAQIFEGTRT